MCAASRPVFPLSTGGEASVPWAFVEEAKLQSDYPEYTCPAAILHGLNDEIVPVASTRTLVEERWVCAWQEKVGPSLPDDNPVVCSVFHLLWRFEQSIVYYCAPTALFVATRPPLRSPLLSPVLLTLCFAIVHWQCSSDLAKRTSVMFVKDDHSLTQPSTVDLTAKSMVAFYDLEGGGGGMAASDGGQPEERDMLPSQKNIEAREWHDDVNFRTCFACRRPWLHVCVVWAARARCKAQDVRKEDVHLLHVLLSWLLCSFSWMT